MVAVVTQITDLRQRLAESQKTVLELEAEREQRQRDYDKKLLLAKSKIENVQVRARGHKAHVKNVQTRPQIKKQTTKERGWTTTLFSFFGVSISGREGVPELWNHWVEAEDSLPAGSAAAPQQTEGVPGEGDPTPQQGECTLLSAASATLP